MLWQLSVGIGVCPLNSLMTKLILVSISSFASQVSSKYMYSNILFNSLQNVVVSSLFIAVLTFLTKGSFSISISLLAAFGSLVSHVLVRLTGETKGQNILLLILQKVSYEKRFKV